MTSLSRGRAATIGLLAAGSALAAGHLVAGLGDPRTSPPVVVGGAFIDLMPPGVKEFAVAVFGTADKLALIIGILGAAYLYARLKGPVEHPIDPMEEKATELLTSEEETPNPKSQIPNPN